MKNYKLIGLTGPTGAGKSAAAQFFREEGCEVIYADFLAREIMNNPVVIGCLRDSFGDDIFAKNTLNRGLLAERAFENKSTKRMLDSITHPFVSALFMKELKRAAKVGAQRIVFDASQLFESGLDVVCDCVIAVTAGREIRMSRIVQRDKVSSKQAAERMDVQLSNEFFKENSDFVIENNSDLMSLKNAVKKTIKTLEVRFGSDT